LAEQILQEMIRAGYLKNNQEPKSKIKQIQFVIEKYGYFASHADLSGKEMDWLIELQAVEIEEIIVPSKKELALIKFAFETMNPRIVAGSGEIDDQEKELQVLLSLHRSLRKADAGMLSYVLWTLYYPEWRQSTPEYVLGIAKQFGTIKEDINSQLNHPWKKNLDKIFKRWAIVFWTIRDIIEKDSHKAEVAFESPEKLELEINKALDARYKSVRKRLATGVVRSIIYVFFTKMLLALLVEFPLDLLISNAVNYFALGVNITFPPILMFFVAITIRTPGKKNSEKVVREIKSLVMKNGEVQKFTLRPPKKRHFLTAFILNVLYLAVFSGCVYYIFKGLYMIGFNWVSAMIFIFFLSVVSFFGIRIRKPVKEIMIINKRDNLFTMLIDFVSLPFATFGRWSSEKFSKVNFIAFIFDFIIEAPFKIFLEVLEDLFGFWREKKDEAYE
jgi:hypothetical protein